MTAFAAGAYTPTDDIGPPPAVYASGSYVAALAGIDPADELGRALGSSSVREIRRFYRRFLPDEPQPDTLEEIPALPLEIVETFFTEESWPTRLEVAEDAADQGDEDPHELFEQLNTARIERLRRRKQDRAERAASGNSGPGGLADRLLTVSALSALPPPTPLLSKFLYRGTLVQMSGHPGDGKTFAALGMSCAVATGRRWNGCDVPEAVPVLYVAAEGSSGVFSRLAAWCGHHGLAVSDLDGKFHVLPQPVQLGDREQVAQLRDAVRATGAGLVVLDTRARCTVGMEENSATEQGLAVAAAESLIAATGATVMVVHHLGVGSNRGRGSSAWDGAVYSDLVLGRNRDGDVLIECVKHKDAPDGCKHLFQLERHTIASDVMPGVDAAALTSLVMTALDPHDAKGTGSTEAVLALITETAGPDGLTGTVIARFAKDREVCSNSTTYAAIKTLVQTGRLANIGSKSRARYIVASDAVS